MRSIVALPAGTRSSPTSWTNWKRFPICPIPLAGPGFWFLRLMQTEDDEPIRIPITVVFDLHTIPPRDVRAVVEEYLIEAHRMGYRALRIIHGRGIGAQREMVRS